MECRLRNALPARHVALQPVIEHLFDRLFVSIVLVMRTASAFDIDVPAPAPAARPHLRLVSEPAPAAPTPTSGRQQLAALLAGLSSGFVLAALATTLGGGNPGGSLLVALVCGTLLGLVLVRARVVTVRARRRRRQRAIAAATRPVTSLPTRVATPAARIARAA